LVVDRLWQ